MTDQNTYDLARTLAAELREAANAADTSSLADQIALAQVYATLAVADRMAAVWSELNTQTRMQLVASMPSKQPPPVSWTRTGANGEEIR